MEKPVFSVTELNNFLKQYFELNPILSNLCIVGEISNYKLYPSGHHYFSLKDSEGSISCVMFKGAGYSLRFRPQNGMKVLAFGRVTVYPRDGKYQLICSSIMPAGAGDLNIAFEQLKAKLDSEGLFDVNKKQRLPLYPERIALITSPVGAAVQDMIRILGSRWPMAKIIIVPVRVQGEEAPAEMAFALQHVNRLKIADVIIIGRGGGSKEDLWAFNDESLARTIARSAIPVISAVGHEPDVTIADYVADCRAATPSNGAELAAPDADEIYLLLEKFEIRLFQAIRQKIADGRRNLQLLSDKKVLRDPKEYISLRRMDVDLLSQKLFAANERMVSNQKSKYLTLSAKLDALSPIKVLLRGYTIAEDMNEKIIRSVHDVQEGTLVKLKFTDGNASCRVEQVIEGN